MSPGSTPLSRSVRSWTTPKPNLSFLFGDEAQETIARLGYRPYKPYATRKAGVSFPPLTLVPITDIARECEYANL